MKKRMRLFPPNIKPKNVLCSGNATRAKASYSNVFLLEKSREAHTYYQMLLYNINVLMNSIQLIEVKIILHLQESLPQQNKEILKNTSNGEEFHFHVSTCTTMHITHSTLCDSRKSRPQPDKELRLEMKVLR